MITRHLQKKIQLDTNSESDDMSLLAMNVEYYFIESENEEIEEYAGKKTYGFEIVKVINDINIESKQIKNYSCSREETKELLLKFIDNTVMPVELPFILDDLIGV